MTVRKPADLLLDDLDEQVIALLEGDGRLSNREIAERVGLSRSAAGARVQRLLAAQHLDIRGTVHPAVLGHAVLVHVAFEVRGAVEPVARAVAARDDCTFASMAAGRRPLVAELRATHLAEIEAALAQLRGLPGVASAETLIYTEVLRDVAGPVGVATMEPDAVDLALLRCLQDDGRASYVELAARVGVSPAGARRRVLRLVAENVVRIGAVVRHAGRQRRNATGVGVRLDGSGDGLDEALRAVSPATFIARTIGRYDALLTINTTTGEDLAAALEQLRAHPDVRDLETWSHLVFVKESYASLRLGDPPSPPSGPSAGPAARSTR